MTDSMPASSGPNVRESSRSTRIPHAQLLAQHSNCVIRDDKRVKCIDALFWMRRGLRASTKVVDRAAVPARCHTARALATLGMGNQNGGDAGEGTAFQQDDLAPAALLRRCAKHNHLALPPLPIALLTAIPAATPVTAIRL
jgi:hypothetical protein